MTSLEQKLENTGKLFVLGGICLFSGRVLSQNSKIPQQMTPEVRYEWQQENQKYAELFLVTTILGAGLYSIGNYRTTKRRKETEIVDNQITESTFHSC